MKRFLPWLAAVAGLVAILAVLPLYQPAQPIGIHLTRPEAKEIADRAAREVGIPVDRAWPSLIWSESPILDKELHKHPRRREAWTDPVLGPRLDVYRVNYYHPDKDKFPPHGVVTVDGRTGKVTGARLRLRGEDIAPAA